jgi:hypothetical protein
MAQHQQQDRPVVTSIGDHEPQQETGWVGWVVFAGILMFLAGSFNAIAGIVALFNRNYYLVPSEGLLVKVDYKAWGWTLLIYGIIVMIAGLGVLVGQTWARVIGVILAGVNAVLNLGFLAAYPIWSTIVIVLDVVVIYALTVHGRETRPTDR